MLAAQVGQHLQELQGRTTEESLKLGEAIVLHDLLPADKAEHLRNVILNHDFPWYWNEHSLVGESSATFKNTTHQFTYIFWEDGGDNSSLSYMVFDIVRAVEAALGIRLNHLLRAKANLLCTMGDVHIDQQYEIHRDCENGDNFYSVVYYVGESDGDTVLFADSGEEAARAQHKNNSAVVFNSLNKHRASLPRQHKRRVVINLVFRGDA